MTFPAGKLGPLLRALEDPEGTGDIDPARERQIVGIERRIADPPRDPIGKLLVCGSRTWTAAQPILDRLHPIHVECFKHGAPKPTLIHGNAPGADRLARNLAIGLGWPTEAHPADWDTHGKRAGFIRNVQMLERAPDLVLAFQVDGSRGTQHTIDEARERGIPVEVYTA